MGILDPLGESVDLSSRPALAGGHRWMRCGSCGRWALAFEAGGRCRQRAAIVKVSDDGTVRYSCPGKLEAPCRTARGSDEACSRAGCGNVAQWTTAGGQRLCQRCWWALAELVMRLWPSTPGGGGGSP